MLASWIPPTCLAFPSNRVVTILPESRLIVTAQHQRSASALMDPAQAPDRAIVTAHRKIDRFAAMSKPKIINDAVHGMVELPPYVRRVMETSLFQRLRRVKQVGNLHYPWPGATHTRYAHSYGTAHLALKYSDHVNIEGHAGEDAARTFVLASLLHDVGHGPFSHTFEATGGDFDHDEFRFALLADNAELNAAVGGPGAAAAIARVWRGDGETATATERVLHTLLAGIAGVDRMDYLLRDLYHTRPQMALDPSCVASIILQTRVDWSNGVVEYTPDGCRFISHMLLMRIYLYSEVYPHRKAQAADYALIQAFGAGLRDHLRDRLTPDRFVELDDACITACAWDPRVPDAARRWLQCALDEHRLPALVDVPEGSPVQPGDLVLDKAAFKDFEVDVASVRCSKGGGSITAFFMPLERARVHRRAVTTEPL